MDHPASALLVNDYHQTITGVRTMHFTNMGGYVFLDSSYTVLYSKATNSYNGAENSINAEGSYDFLEISLSHGEGNVSGGKYAYVYLPEATVSGTENYDDIVLLKRNDNAHAVLEKTLGAIGCVFFDYETVEIKGSNATYTSVRKIETSATCAVIIGRGENGETVISVADPTQLNATVELEIEIEGVTELVSADAGVSATVSNGIAKITVNTFGSLGKTFNLTVK
jgi:hypothetical protein